MGWAYRSKTERFISTARLLGAFRVKTSLMPSLKRILCRKLPEPNHPVQLDEAEATHATRVLRLKDGDPVEAMDGQGHASVATLKTRGGPTRLEFFKPQSAPSASVPIVVPVVLEMAVLKGDAMEWVVEKAVELGVASLVPVLTAHTVVQMDRKGPEAFRERWQKIADQALKQCGRLERLEVLTPIALDKLITQPLSEGSERIWCDEAERENAPSLLSWVEKTRSTRSLSCARHLLVGPEGGWSAQEREHFLVDLTCVSLGPIVLRAETAAVSALSLLAADFRLPKDPIN